MFAAVFLILVAILYRVIPVMMGVEGGWASNFAPMSAIVLCGAIYLPRRAAVILPLAAMIVSDVVLNVFHYHQTLVSWELLSRYVALACVSGLGFLLRGRSTTLRLFGATISGSVLFYFITNTGSWISEPLYVKSFAGWWQAMTVGLPGLPPTWMFSRNTFVSDLLFTGLFLLCHTVTSRGAHEPKLARQTVLVS